ncbi:hypothetical protein [Facklamia miroungae]|uniref:Uncharacterized protein n=1 Tax=Facklamia miroungae TaxID=120956 RepID=A0A1G7TIF3_9LACT|nr:hypothetical protein [Facklamia miroungae]NKZ29823.1 hypothetical protein [Facklamia miroungae]SDG35088.1 hypothetical protein SAMN05421791_10631 [Facklamia miroungae]
MFPTQKTDKRPFFSKRLLVFFLVMIFLVFSSSLFFSYLNDLKVSFQNTFVQDPIEWQYYPIGQELLDNRSIPFDDLAKERIELMVLSYNYSQAGRIGEKSIKEITLYLWDFNREKVTQVNIDPQLNLSNPTEKASSSINDFGLKHGDLALVEQLVKKVGLPIDFLIILDLDSLEDTAKNYSSGVLFSKTSNKEFSSRDISQKLGHNLMDYHHFLKIAKELNEIDCRVKSNIDFEHFLKMTFYYNLQKWQEFEVIDLSSNLTIAEREKVIASLKSS